MAGTIFGIPFDDEIFMNMWNEEPDPELLAMLNSGAVVDDAMIAEMIQGQGNFYTIPFFNILDGDDQNYDGQTDITAVSYTHLVAGEFETLFFDCLDPEERALVSRVQPDKEALLLQEIQLLTVREHRMLRRIESLKESAMTEDSKSKGMTAVKRKVSIDDDAVEYTGVLGQIQAVEDALTRVQARRQKAIEALHRFGFDDARLELETMKFELELSRADNQGKETPNDGFLEALGAEAANVWGDSDE